MTKRTNIANKNIDLPVAETNNNKRTFQQCHQGLEKKSDLVIHVEFKEQGRITEDMKEIIIRVQENEITNSDSSFEVDF